MKEFIKLHTKDGGTILVNIDNISSILPYSNRIVFNGGDTDDFGTVRLEAASMQKLLKYISVIE